MCGEEILGRLIVNRKSLPADAGILPGGRENDRHGDLCPARHQGNAGDRYVL